MWQRLLCSTLTVTGLVCLAGRSLAAPAPQPSDAALSTAITVLTGEYEAHAGDPTKPLRTACDYFKQNPAKEITVDVVVAALGKTMDGPGAQQAYVKWQLLSAVDGKFPDKLVSRAQAVYRQAPLPLPRPGLKEKAKLDARLGEVGKALSDELTRAVQAWAKDNAPILAYRDELAAKLPPSLDTALAMLEDIDERLSAVAVREQVDKELDGCARAIAGDPKTQKSASILRDRLYTLGMRTITYYESVAANADGKMTWKSGTEKLTQDKDLIALYGFLDDTARKIAAAEKAEREKRAEEARRQQEANRKNQPTNPPTGTQPPTGTRPPTRLPPGGGIGGGPIGL